MQKKDISNEQKIYECIHRKMHKPFKWILAVGIIFVVIAILFDCGVGCRDIVRLVALWFGWDIESEEIVFKLLNFIDGSLYGWICNVRKVIFDNIDTFYSMLITIDTILAAAVIFFYSVQDNRKEGIPHRAILAYSFGSYTIPVFFFLAMILLPVGLLLSLLGMKTTFLGCIAFVYFLQMLVIVLILVSTSQSFGQHVISNAEIRQYWLLCGMDDDVETGRWNNTQSVWTYLMHYLEQAVKSDELLSDKMMLIRELLKTPYYEKELSVLQRTKNRHYFGKGMAAACLENNSLKRIYEFYYENISSAMEYLNKDDKNSERDKFYMVLYEFLENLQKLHQKIERKEIRGVSEADKNYMMTIAGIVNAVLESRAPDAEGFCNYIFNKCMEDEKIRGKQIGLYFLFREYLYRTCDGKPDDDQVMFMEHLQEIRGIANWSMDKDEKTKSLYYDFWRIWMNLTTVSFKNSMIYFRDAIVTLCGEDYSSCPISYAMLLLKKYGEKHK